MNTTQVLPRSICGYKNHSMKEGSGFHYWDDDNGLPKRGIKICRPCYAEHILKYYSDSKIAEYIRKNPDEFKE